MSCDQSSGVHGELLLVRLGLHWFPGIRPWLARRSFPWPRSRVQFGQVRGLCLNPCTSVPVERWDLGMGYGWKLSVYCDEVALPKSMA